MSSKEISNRYFKIRSSEIKASTKSDEISIWLDTYEDIFSDFDPRPYTHRSLSDEFISELKKASKVKTAAHITLRFFISENKRNLREEELIKGRLTDYFKRHTEIIRKEIKHTKKISYIMLGTGAALFLCGTYLHGLRADSFLRNLGIVLTEPGGWFLTWTGLERLFGLHWSDGNKKSELKFFTKMANCKIEFLEY